MLDKMNTEAYLDNLLGFGRFASLKDGLYVLKLFNGMLVDVVMYMTVLKDGTIKTRVEEVNWRASSVTVLHEETMSVERVCNIIKDQYHISAILTRLCNDFLEKTIGELSEIEESKAVGDINLDYCKIVSLGQFEVEVLYNSGKYECTLYPMYDMKQKFYTKDIDRLESFLSKMKKKYDATVKRVIEEELGNIK